MFYKDAEKIVEIMNRLGYEAPRPAEMWDTAFSKLLHAFTDLEKRIKDLEQKCADLSK